MQLWGHFGAEDHYCAWLRSSKNPSLGRDAVPLSMSRGRSIGMAITKAYWLRFDRDASLSCWFQTAAADYD